MKTGKIFIETISIWCPHCGEFIGSPDTGASLIDSEAYHKMPNTITCPSCGEKFKKPAVAQYVAHLIRAPQGPTP
jgi:ribosomal protein S27E